MPEEDLVGSPGETTLEDGYRDEPVKRPPPKHEIPPEVRALLGDAHLLPGEDRATYEALLSKVAQARAPKDMVEWLNVKDMADAAWEAERLKRLKTRLLTQRVEAELCRRLENALAEKIRIRRLAATRRAPEQRLDAQRPHDHRGNPAPAARRHRPDPRDGRGPRDGHEKFEILDRMLTTAVTRRQRAAQDIETRRLPFARRFRLKHVFPARCQIM